jgi:hypothetical protein
MSRQTQYRKLITTLDCALTGKTYKKCLETFQNSVCRKPDQLIDGELYYLSDGGYSRIFFHDFTLEIYLASESRDEVKVAWERCSELIADLNRFLQEYYHDILLLEDAK